MKKILLLFAFLFMTGLFAIAADLIVTGSEAKAIRDMSWDMLVIAKSITPCMDKQNPNTYIYQSYYTCICEEKNQLAIIGFKKLNALYKKHPNWANYKYVKTDSYTDSNGLTSSFAFDMAEYKKMLKALKPCIE